MAEQASKITQISCNNCNTTEQGGIKIIIIVFTSIDCHFLILNDFLHLLNITHFDILLFKSIINKCKILIKFKSCDGAVFTTHFAIYA